MNKQKEKGQAMVEAMVAMSVIVVGLLGVFTLSSNSISLNRVAADRYVAVNLANEGVELVKNLIDNNEWNAIPGFDNSTSQYEIDYNDLKVKPLGGEGSGARPIYFSKNGSGYYAYDDGDLDLNVYVSTVQDLTRIITIENVNGDSEHKKVVSTVSWKAKDGAMLSFSVEDHFYNLKDFELL